MLFVAGLLFVACCVLSAVCGLLFVVVSCSLFIVIDFLFPDTCLFSRFVIRCACLLFRDCCLSLFVVC